MMSATAQCWLYLVLAIGMEVAGTTAMKVSDGLSRLWPSVLMVVFYGASIGFLALALKRLDVSLAYAVWAGVGITLVTVIGVFCFGEPLTYTRIICIGLIVLGVMGLYLSP